MARKKRGSNNKPEKKTVAKGEATPLEGRQPSQAEDSARDVIAQPQAPVSESRHDAGFSFPDIFDIKKALRYLLSLVEPMIPEPYRPKLPLFAAIVVMLIGLGYLVHIYWWWIVGVPDVCGIVYNDSSVDDTVPRDGLLYIYKYKDNESRDYLSHASFQIRLPEDEVGKSKSVSVPQGKRQEIELRLDENTNHVRKKLYEYYRMGNTYVALTFFPGRMREYTPERIPFNKKTLTSEEPAFTLELIGKDIPAVHGTVVNVSDEPDAIAGEGRFFIYEPPDPDTEILNGLFEIQLPRAQQDEDGKVPIKAGEKRRIPLVLPQTKELYGIYREGDACLVLTFFPARRREFTLEKIRFNRKILTSEESLFAFDLIGRKALWRSPPIKVCFETDEGKIDPNCLWSLERSKKLLEREAMRSGWFRIVSCKEFEKCKESFDAYVKRPERERVNIARGRDPALYYLDWPTVVQVIVGLSREDSQTQWISVTDAQNRIPKEKDEKEGEWPVHFGETQDQMKEEIEKIVNRLRRTIVRRYPIRGEIKEIVEKEDSRMAILNVGSVMGVGRDTRFDVLSEGTDRPTGATVEIRVVSTGEEARGRLKDGNDIEAGARVRSTED